VPEKGIFDLLEALGRVASQNDNQWNLKVVGWGDREKVEHVAQQHGIGDRIKLIERLDHNALAVELEKSQLAILPSYKESFGLAIAESQATGLPVVAYEVGAVPEVVEHGKSGWLVKPGRIDLLVEVISEALQDSATTFQMGLDGRDRVKRLFSWEQSAKLMLQNIGELARSNQS